MKTAIKKLANKIANQDCLTLLAKMPDNSIDMCFADPPFNLNKRYTSYNDVLKKDDYVQWCEAWLSELVRVTKPTGSIFVHNIPKWLTYYAEILNKQAFFRHWIAWQAVGRPLGKTLLPSHYGILFYVKDEKLFKFYDLRAPHLTCRLCGKYLKDYGGKESQRHPFGALVGDVWTDIHRIRHNKRRDSHPCQLPPHLLERIILMSTDVGDVVFDPFMGTGTTAIAAKKLGRHYIGSEIDKEYVSIAKDKIATTMPTTHEEAYISKYLGNIITIRDVDAIQIMAEKKKEEKQVDEMSCIPKSKQVSAARLSAKEQLMLLDKKVKYGSGK
ncbi:MAG: site-specific DNA-methyltransferase [Proteobacteria bacterium]|nr:site-specific DNA-methyltransferase [Pseudomonadota bacterium]